MKEESPLKRLFVQVSHYSIASLLTTVAGLVSFPLLTRVFSVADYGVMNLIAATLTLSVALGKVGVQHSIVRYRTEVRAGKGAYSQDQLYSTTFLGMGATGLLTMLIVAAGVRIVPESWLDEPRVRNLFTVAGLVIGVQVLESVMFNFLRADQETSFLMKYQVIKKYLGLGIILLAVFMISRTLMAYYWSVLVTETVAIGSLMVVFLRRDRGSAISRRNFSRPLYFELLGFGIPMMIGYEMSGLILGIGDRYVINGTIGAAPLGLYSAAYNLCQYVQAVFVASVAQAVMPLYMQMWDAKGRDETVAFIGRSLRTYVLFGAPVVAGLASVGPQLLPTLASEKYASGAVIIPWVIAGMVVDGSNSMVAAGLFIHRKTKHIMTVIVASATINVVANLIAVPRIGILGAAIATLGSYAFASCALAFAARKYLPVKLPWGTLLRAGLAALGMYASLSFVCPGRHLVTVGVRALIGGPIYLILIALIDPDARALVAKGRARLRRSRLAEETS